MVASPRTRVATAVWIGRWYAGSRAEDEMRRGRNFGGARTAARHWKKDSCPTPTMDPRRKFAGTVQTVIAPNRPAGVEALAQPISGCARTAPSLLDDSVIVGRLLYCWTASPLQPSIFLSSLVTSTRQRAETKRRTFASARYPFALVKLYICVPRDYLGRHGPSPGYCLNTIKDALASSRRPALATCDTPKLALLSNTLRHAFVGLTLCRNFRRSSRTTFASGASSGWPLGHTAIMAPGAADKKAERSYISSAVDSINPWGGSRSSTPTPRDPQHPDSAGLSNPGDHSLSSLYGQSLKRYPPDCPPLVVKWFHAVDVCCGAPTSLCMTLRSRSRSRL